MVDNPSTRAFPAHKITKSQNHKITHMGGGVTNVTDVTNVTNVIDVRDYYLLLLYRCSFVRISANSVESSILFSIFVRILG